MGQWAFSRADWSGNAKAAAQGARTNESESMKFLEQLAPEIGQHPCIQSNHVLRLLPLPTARGSVNVIRSVVISPNPNLNICPCLQPQTVLELWPYRTKWKWCSQSPLRPPSPLRNGTRSQKLTSCWPKISNVNVLTCLPRFTGNTAEHCCKTRNMPIRDN